MACTRPFSLSKKCKAEYLAISELFDKSDNYMNTLSKMRMEAGLTFCGFLRRLSDFFLILGRNFSQEIFFFFGSAINF